MKDIQILGVDLDKNSCSVVGLDLAGRVLLRRRMRREGVVALAAKLPGCVVAMEACCGAHHLGRLLVAQGHEVRLMSPEYVRPYVKAQKNDDRDAEHWAVVASLVETCKLNGVDPQANLADGIARIVAGYPQSQIDDLLPWAYATPPLKAVA